MKVESSPRTAHGKLNAVMTPTTPRGFHVWIANGKMLTMAIDHKH